MEDEREKKKRFRKSLATLEKENIKHLRKYCSEKKENFF